MRAYAAARPVDPWGHATLAELELEAGDPSAAVAPLEALDAVELRSFEWARTLSRLYTDLGRADEAFDAAERALYREPYNAGLREDAAAAALRAGNLDAAAHHITALTRLEPDAEIHRKRLEAINQKLKR